MSFSVQYKDNELYMENVPIREVADNVGTPCFLYSYNSIADKFNNYSEALSDTDSLICFSVKANSNIAVLKAFADLGAGFDIVSIGELKRVIKAGGDVSKVVFSGIGKTGSEIEAAINAGILFFNVESVDELNSINEIGKKMSKKAPIALRVNPDIDPQTHPYISTGFKKSKFGIELDRAVQVYRDASKMEGVDIVGIDAHIGSQIFDLSSFSDSVRRLVLLADTLRSENIEIKYIDIGGGLAINYKMDELPPPVGEYAKVIKESVLGNSCKIVVEPGRSLIGNAGVMITQVLYTKEGKSKNFVIVDAAMNDLIRPAFYNSHHEIITVKKSSDLESMEFDIVGPICESGDFLAVDREFPPVSKGDYLSVLSAGAYGFVMSSNYNSRPRAAEVMVKGDRFEVIKERETFNDLVRGEKIPFFL